MKRIDDAVFFYQHNPELNLRLVEGSLSREDRNVVSALDGLIGELPRKVLCRTILRSTLDAYMEQAGVDDVMALKGRIVTNIPYMSTSRNSLAHMLAVRKSVVCEPPVCMVIDTRGKAKGIVVNDYLESRGIRNDFTWQNEYILERNLRLLIDEVVVEKFREWHFPTLYTTII